MTSINCKFLKIFPVINFQIIALNGAGVITQKLQAQKFGTNEAASNYPSVISSHWTDTQRERASVTRRAISFIEL
jgi:hypothetical protein